MTSDTRGHVMRDQTLWEVWGQMKARGQVEATSGLWYTGWRCRELCET